MTNQVALLCRPDNSEDVLLRMLKDFAGTEKYGQLEKLYRLNNWSECLLSQEGNDAIPSIIESLEPYLHCISSVYCSTEYSSYETMLKLNLEKELFITCLLEKGAKSEEFFGSQIRQFFNFLSLASGEMTLAITDAYCIRKAINLFSNSHKITTHSRANPLDEIKYGEIVFFELVDHEQRFVTKSKEEFLEELQQRPESFCFSNTDSVDACLEGLVKDKTSF